VTKKDWEVKCDRGYVSNQHNYYAPQLHQDATDGFVTCDKDLEPTSIHSRGTFT